MRLHSTASDDWHRESERRGMDVERVLHRYRHELWYRPLPGQEVEEPEALPPALTPEEEERRQQLFLEKEEQEKEKWFQRHL